MDSKFIAHLETLEPQLLRLLAKPPITPDQLPSTILWKGIYLISEGNLHSYVGRSNDIKERIGRHCGAGATHHQAVFAFRLAREATGRRRCI